MQSSGISISNESQSFLVLLTIIFTIFEEHVFTRLFALVHSVSTVLTLWLRALFSLDRRPHCANSSHRIQNNTFSFLRKRKKTNDGQINLLSFENIKVAQKELRKLLSKISNTNAFSFVLFHTVLHGKW